MRRVRALLRNVLEVTGAGMRDSCLETVIFRALGDAGVCHVEGYSVITSHDGCLYRNGSAGTGREFDAAVSH